MVDVYVEDESEFVTALGQAGGAYFCRSHSAFIRDLGFSSLAPLFLDLFVFVSLLPRSLASPLVCSA